MCKHCRTDKNKNTSFCISRAAFVAKNWTEVKNMPMSGYSFFFKLTLYCGLDRVRYPQFLLAYSCQRRGIFYPFPFPDHLSRSKYDRDPRTFKRYLNCTFLFSCQIICIYLLFVNNQTTPINQNFVRNGT